MKKVALMMLLTTLLIIVSACSNNPGNSVKASNASSMPVNQEEHYPVSDDSSNIDDNNLESDEASQSTNTNDELEKGNETTTNELDSSIIDVGDYLNESYAIDNTHFVTDIWENEDTGRIDYTVNILPDTKEFGQEIDGVFKNGSPYFDDRTKEMFDVATKIMNDLTNDHIHIDSVNWVSYDGVFSIMLLQDFDNSNLNVREDVEKLSDYSSEQIEYARVWLQLGPNQDIDGLYVRHIPAGTPLDSEYYTSVSYPEDVIQLTGSRLVDGIVTYSGNGDGTINLYNIPRRWYGGFSPPDDVGEDEILEEMEGIIKNTKLVYINPGDDESVIKLIKLLHGNN